MKPTIIALIIAFFGVPTFAQYVDLAAKIPVSAKVRTGVLPNGMTYYIRENHKPEHRAELRLVENAGSVLETDNQQGLAHLCEHMAFNGTKNFPKQDLVNFLERTGIRFGADLNAYTSFDETVYMLQIPTDTEATFLKGFQVLEDWAFNVSYDGDEIQKERGVVVEEWRLGQGANERMLRQWYPVYMKDSRYAVRLPIGQKEIIEGAPQDTLRAYYKKWYRPDFQAIIAVGDFDAAKVEQIIKDRFGKIPKPKNKIDRPSYLVPDQNNLLVSVATDKEASYTGIQLSYKLPLEEEKTVNDYRHSLVEQIFTSMLTDRYSELQQQANPPFSYSYAGYGHAARTKDEYTNFAVVNDTGVARGLKTMLTENERLRQYGFTQTELDRTVKQMVRNMERQYNERDKTESRNFTYELVNNFLEKEPIPGIEWEYDMYQRLLPTIKLEEVNALSGKWITDGKNCVIVVTAPQKEGVKIPSEDQLKKIYSDVKQMKIDAYVDKTSDKPLLASKPQGTTVVSEKKVDEFGIIEWKLANGARVILKPTDFKNDEILFGAYAYGGSSLYPDQDFQSADNAAQIMDNSGTGDFDNVTLDKYLSDKIVRLSGNISELQQTLSGSCSPKDLETFFQLLYLKFTAPRKDQTAFDAFISQQRSFIQNQNNDPTRVLFDTVQVTMYNHNYRYRPDDENMLKEINLDRAYQIYKERFADASEYTFFFVGSFSPESIKPFVETYIGALPSKSGSDTFKDLGIVPPGGQINKSVKKGSEPKSYVTLIYNGTFDYNRHNRNEVNALLRLLNIKLRETMREDMSGVYGVSVYPSLSKYPKPLYKMNISFGCAPDNVDKLIAAAHNVIDSVKNNGCKQEDLLKVKELTLKEREVQLKQNSFWLQAIQQSDMNKEDIREINDFTNQIQSLTSADFKRLAAKYFAGNNYAQFVLYPVK
ncbi:MAG TPA: insulinase family protein [Chitinophagales bacterium]|nr:insulinase family protein [Chitinophagales bacterium]